MDDKKGPGHKDAQGNVAHANVLLGEVARSYVCNDGMHRLPVKQMVVQSGQKLSLQKYYHRA
ncbi:hypothetical protein PY793_12735 [Acetobacter fabarum]|uniref:hypothetical protein n=1 Tax=Acetobacter fabarum TaxID=483199 RepID=UPI00312B546D